MKYRSVWLACLFAGTAISQGTLSEYTTYVGDANTCHVARVRADAAGNTIVVGNRSSGSLTEMFVAKLDSTGKLASFLTLGGNGADTVNDMALDAAGNIVLAGATTSTSFPLYNPMQSTPGPGFVVKLDSRTNQILFATYFPAAVSAVATDSSGNVYLTGSTMSAKFPVTPGLPAGPASGVSSPMIAAAFLTKLSAAGDRILYSTLLSGRNKACGCCSSCFLSPRFTGGVGLAVDPAGNAYLAGNTDTTDLPVTSGAFLQNGIGAFVAKVNAAGTALSYLTYIGAANYVIGGPLNIPGNSAAAIAVDSAGAVYLAGSTSDPAFPATPGAYQTSFGGPLPSEPYTAPLTDAFALQLKPDGSGLRWATYLGGGGADAATALAVDASGNVWLGGTTASVNFPNEQGWSQGGEFLVGFNPSLVYAARYPAGTVSASLAVDPSGALHAAGTAGIISAILPFGKSVSRIFGIANAAYGPITAQMARNEVISIFGPHIGNGDPRGVRVMMGYNALSLLYVSDSQINAVAPLTWTGTAIQVTNNGISTPLFPVVAIDSDAEIFRNPDGSAAAINQDGTVNSPDHPAPIGSFVTLWVTGTGLGSCCAVLTDGSQEVFVTPVEDPVPGVVRLSFPAPSFGTVVVNGSHAATIYVTR